MAILLANVPLGKNPKDEQRIVCKRLKIKADELLELTLVRKSLDARHGRQRWIGAYRVVLADEDSVLAREKGVRLWMEKDDIRYGLSDGAKPEPRQWAPGSRIIVVGAGPAGLFAALYLAEAGANVLLLDRGGAVKERVKEVNGFWRAKGDLDTENNLLFGEGGAGTFSDGKIYTRRRDGEVGYILRRFVDFGAKSDILKEGWAHLGTDKVRAILPVFRERLRELGVEVRYGARVDDLLVSGGEVIGVRLHDGTEEMASAVMVAAGHSARDTMRMMVSRGATATPRPIAVGARVEHPQSVIDAGRYAGKPRREGLPAASYRLAYHPEQGPKARTFCMCPGGMVVPAMSERGQVVVNGMSFAAQRSYWANSAIIVEVEPSQYGASDPTAGYRWQQEIEAKAFEAGGGTYAAPAQRVEDFLNGVASTALPKVSYPMGAAPGDLSKVLPGYILKGMANALKHFNRQLPGFISEDAVLIAPETRTTSPIRFLRTDGYQSVGLKNLYPVGEGAGYGGGIVSCALDGLRAAKALTESRALAS